MAGDADYKGRLNAVASQLLDDIKGTDRYSKSRFVDEVFPETLDMSNAEETLRALAPRTEVTINNDGTIIGGDAILDNQGRVNLDKIPSNNAELYNTAPDAVNSDSSEQMRALLYPEQVEESPALKRARDIGMAMQRNDVDAYQRAGTPVQVTDEAAEYLASKFTKGGRTPKPLRSTSFAKVGGLGTEKRSQILDPTTDRRFLDLSKEEQKAYMDRRVVDLTKQWLAQGGASIANPSTVIVPPGVNSHMDHVRALSSSKDTVGDTGWGYSDAPSNFSWLDAEANVHSKLNYSLQGQHLMMRLADEMRRKGQAFPARLSQSELGDPNRERLSDEKGAIRLMSDKASDTTEAGENLLSIIQYLNKYS